MANQTHTIVLTSGASVTGVDINFIIVYILSNTQENCLHMTAKEKRKEIKRILSKLEDSNRLVFLRMYSPKDLDKDINLVVDTMPAKQLSWALKQCKTTYHSILTIIKASAQ